MVKHSLFLLKEIVVAFSVWLSIPFIGGLYYACCGEHAFEQSRLDPAVAHLRRMREACDDPDLQGILDYTIDRYSRVGAWDVMFFPCIGPYGNDYKAMGINMPMCPGITLDPELLSWEPEEMALVVVHEAMHDYRPWFGHSHIVKRDRKLRVLSEIAQ